MKIDARIDGRIALVTYARPDGRQVAKSIPTDALCKILSAEARGEEEFVIFPTGMRFHGRMGPKVIVGFEEPEAERRINYRGSPDGRATELNSWNVKLPYSLTIVEFLEEGANKVLSFRRFYQYALKSPFFGLDTPLFIWPFSNVYDDGSCCMGNITIPKYPSLKDTTGAVNLFHLGTYNGDMSNNRINRYDPPEGGATITNPFMLWRHLQNDTAPKPFPYQVLKSLSTLKTMLSRAGFGSIL